MNGHYNLQTKVIEKYLYTSNESVKCKKLEIYLLHILIAELILLLEATIHTIAIDIMFGITICGVYEVVVTIYCVR